MPVFVDQLLSCIPHKQYVWHDSCHLFINEDEDIEVLHAFARRIGMKRTWFQVPDDLRAFPHYDLNYNKRQLAVAHGAIQVDRREAVEIIRERRRAAWARLQGAKTA